MAACQFAFRLARNYKTSVVLLHSTSTPPHNSSILGEIIGTEKRTNLPYGISRTKPREERKFDDRIKQEIASKTCLLSIITLSPVRASRKGDTGLQRP